MGILDNQTPSLVKFSRLLSHRRKLHPFIIVTQTPFFVDVFQLSRNTTFLLKVRLKLRLLWLLYPEIISQIFNCSNGINPLSPSFFMDPLVEFLGERTNFSNNDGTVCASKILMFPNLLGCCAAKKGGLIQLEQQKWVNEHCQVSPSPNQWKLVISSF